MHKIAILTNIRILRSYPPLIVIYSSKHNSWTQFPTDKYAESPSFPEPR